MNSQHKLPIPNLAGGLEIDLMKNFYHYSILLFIMDLPYSKIYSQHSHPSFQTNQCDNWMVSLYKTNMESTLIYWEDSILVNTKVVCMAWKHTFSHEQYTISLTFHARGNLFIPRKLPDSGSQWLFILWATYYSFTILGIISSSLTRKEMSMQ